MSRQAKQHLGFLLAAVVAVVAASCSDKPRAEPSDPVLQQAEDELQAITDKFPSFARFRSRQAGPRRSRSPTHWSWKTYAACR